MSPLELTCDAKSSPIFTLFWVLFDEKKFLNSDSQTHQSSVYL